MLVGPQLTETRMTGDSLISCIWLTCCRQGIVSDIVRCCSLERAPAAVDAALQCIIEMAALPALQVCASEPSAYTVHT